MWAACVPAASAPPAGPRADDAVGRHARTGAGALAGLVDAGPARHDRGGRRRVDDERAVAAPAGRGSRRLNGSEGTGPPSVGVEQYQRTDPWGAGRAAQAHRRAADRQLVRLVVAHHPPGQLDRARRTPAPASRRPFGRSAGVDVEVDADASRSWVAGGVSRYERHGCSQCERWPNGTPVSCRGSIGFASVCQAPVGPGVGVGIGIAVGVGLRFGFSRLAGCAVRAVRTRTALPARSRTPAALSTGTTGRRPAAGAAARVISALSFHAHRTAGTTPSSSPATSNTRSPAAAPRKLTRAPRTRPPARPARDRRRRPRVGRRPLPAARRL